ncbi:GrpB family protein [Arthrobacter sp. E3]|uniref:GrpB family protein n=1 Tax=Arthrobacter sp. E3 TaxID=517402 RepID=UPI001A9513B8|nr:GrpB family protein [Arthrobacter sp. E3]
MTAEPDEHLDTVLIGGREERLIVIVDYDFEWPSLFDALASVIEVAVGEGALSVEHIGSTSVPGLPAKPIIDILLIVEDVADENVFLGKLEAVGFELRVREIGHCMMRTTARDVHIHVLSAKSSAISDYLDFRDWLREDESDRHLYATTKKHLAQQPWLDMNDYAEAKTEVVTQILSRARRWLEAGSVVRYSEASIPHLGPHET